MRAYEKNVLQALIIIGSVVPLTAGFMGVLSGGALLSGQSDATLDNHFVYLSGILFAIGLGFLSSVPSIETKTTRVRVLTFLVVIGGAARLSHSIVNDFYPLASMLALGMELVVTPLICLWQKRISDIYR